MKSFLVIGTGKFGHFICRRLAELGHEVMIADRNEDRMSDLLDCTVSARIGDCTRRDVLETFGVEDFDECLVCMGENFQNSLQITDLLKELGARYVITVASTEIQAKFLLRNGADRVVFPDRDMANRLAVSISNDNIFDNFELSDEYSMFEISTPTEWLGKTVVEADVRKKYGLTILGRKKPNGRLTLDIHAGYVFNKDDHLMVVGSMETIAKVTDR